MTTATLLIDTRHMAMPRETGNPGRTTAEPSGEGAQQRFADMLPRARAASERSVEEVAAAEDVPAKGETSDEPVTAEPAAPPDRQARADDEQTADVAQEAAGWLLAGAAPVMTPRQAGTDAAVGPTAKAPGPVVQVVAVPEQATPSAATPEVPEVKGRTSSPLGYPPQGTTVGQTPATADQSQDKQQTNPTQQTQQPPAAQDMAAGAELLNTPVGANAAAMAVVPDGQQAAQSPAAADGQVPLAPQTPQPTAPVPVAQTMPHDGQAAQDQAPKEPIQGSPGSQTADAASQGGREGSTAVLASTSKSGQETGAVEENLRQGQIKTQTAVTEVGTPVGSEKTSPGQDSSAEGRQDHMLRHPATTANEDATAEIAPAEGKDVALAGSKEMAAVMPEVRVSSAGDTGVFSQRLAAQVQNQASPDAQGASGSEAAPARSPVQSVGDQILDSMQASATRGDREVLIRLKPPEMGTVLVRFQERGDQLTGTVEVSNRETRREIEQALPQVVRALQEAGVHVRRVEVVTSDPSDRGPGGEHAQQETGTPHQGSSQGREYSQAAGQMRWPRGAGEPGAARQRLVQDERGASVPQGRIDVLL